MRKREIQWVNSPVLIEAIMRYQEGRLHKPMQLWIEKLLELTPNSDKKLVS